MSHNTKTNKKHTISRPRSLAPFRESAFLLLLIGAFVAISYALPRTKVVSEYNNDGAWNWFTEPRAVRHKGVHDQTYVGWVTKEGDITISSYDNNTKEQKTSVLHPRLQKDDHNNPSILTLADGRIMAFYSAHAGPSLYYRISSKPEDITAWETEQQIPVNTSGEKGYTYPNPIRLSGENNTIYLFWRGGSWQPTYSTSPDNGTTWTPAQTLINNANHRPYVKYISNNNDTIHFTYTDGHPRNTNSSLYYAQYKNGVLNKADGTKIKGIESLPIAPSEGDTVFKDPTKQTKTWVWDIAIDSTGNPIIVYATFPSNTNHQYHYARWSGTQWVSHKITDAGTYIDGPYEPYYSGGLSIDHNNPSVVYISREINGTHEIERWATKDNGSTWESQPITSKSAKKNFRPVTVRGYPGQGPLSVLWMSGDYTSYTNFATSLKAYPGL